MHQIPAARIGCIVQRANTGFPPISLPAPLSIFQLPVIDHFLPGEFYKGSSAAQSADGWTLKFQRQGFVIRSEDLFPVLLAGENELEGGGACGGDEGSRCGYAL